MNKQQTILRLQMLLDAACPNFGVSIGRWDDRATWRIDLKPEATAQQYEAAQAIMQAFDPRAEPVTVPEFVSPWQAREALRLAGLLPAVNAHIESLGENHQVYIAWHYADRISRVSPLVASIAPLFSLTDKMVDDLFVTAAGLRL